MLIDLGQVLAAFEDCLVVVGRWVPDLLLKNADEPHVGSIDVDLALDTEKLTEGRYVQLVEALLKTRRYQQADELFKLFTEVDLGDGQPAVRVDPWMQTAARRPLAIQNWWCLQGRCRKAEQIPSRFG
ncbi:MAG: hypothetical protein NT154_13670 [Verrucomicrobia bacterium]|nr:hypothetical protein [Verrucomicrobiota bacterium]